MRDLIKPLPRRQSEIMVHDLVPGGIIKTHILLQIRLHDPQMDAVDKPRWIAREPRHAKATQRHKCERGQCDWQQWPPFFFIPIEQSRRRGADGDYDEALKVGFSAYRKLKNSIENSEIARVQVLIAHCYLRLGLLTEAEEFFMDALSSYRRAEDRVGIANCYNNIGVLHKNACRWTRAQASLSKALEIAKTLGLAQVLIRVQLNLGIVYGKLRRFPDAISSFNAAVNGAERFGDKLHLTRCLLMLGRTYVQAGEYSKAEKQIVRAQATAEDCGYSREAALADEYLGELMIARRSYHDALANLRSSLKRARKIAPEGDIAAESLRRIADVEYYLNRPIDALAHIEEGVEIASTCGEIYELGYFFRTQGLCHSRMGKTDAALASHRPAPGARTP